MPVIGSLHMLAAAHTRVIRLGDPQSQILVELGWAARFHFPYRT
jgi:hypothetical protein